MKKWLLFSLVLAVASVCVVAPIQAGYPHSLLDRLRSKQIQILYWNLQQAIAEGRIKNDEWEKLDFTQPDEHGFGDNLEYEVFNPKSPRTIIIDDKPVFPLVPQKLINDLTFGDEKKLRFGLFRMAFTMTEGGDAEIQTLAAVIKGVNGKLCEEGINPFYQVIKRGGEVLFQAERGLLIQRRRSDNQEGLYTSCVLPERSENYFILPLARRARLSSGKDEIGWRDVKTNAPAPGVDIRMIFTP